MTNDSGARSTEWRRGISIGHWKDDELAFATLLDALTSDLVAAETTGLELDAGPRRSMADVVENRERIQRDQMAESRQELQAFREALLDARNKSGADGQGEAAYDSAKPDEDRKADLLIQYLVRPDYAEVRTDEPDPGHHVYYIRVAWERLRALAGERGQPLSL